MKNNEIELKNELFYTNGLMIIEYNYLEIYTFEKWYGKQIFPMQMNQIFKIHELSLLENKTKAPELLSESDLINLMDKNQIGTDATIAQHIQTIIKREFVKLTSTQRFRPCELGIALVNGYQAMQQYLNEPKLRAEMESAMNDIANGIKTKQQVLSQWINKMKYIFQDVVNQAEKLDQSMALFFQSNQPININSTRSSSSSSSTTTTFSSSSSSAPIRESVTNQPIENYYMNSNTVAAGTISSRNAVTSNRSSNTTTTSTTSSSTTTATRPTSTSAAARSTSTTASNMIPFSICGQCNEKLYLNNNNKYLFCKQCKIRLSLPKQGILNINTDSLCHYCNYQTIEIKTSYQFI